MYINIADQQTKITHPDQINEVIRSIYNQIPEEDREKEHFWAVGFTARQTIKFIELVSLGTINEVTLHCREVFRSAIKNSAVSIIVAHNHPSGSVEPSPEDVITTDRLQKAGNIIGVQLLDHIIVTDTDCYSFKANGKL